MKWRVFLILLLLNSVEVVSQDAVQEAEQVLAFLPQIDVLNKFVSVAQDFLAKAEQKGLTEKNSRDVTELAVQTNGLHRVLREIESTEKELKKQIAKKSEREIVLLTEKLYSLIEDATLRAEKIKDSRILERVKKLIEEPVKEKTVLQKIKAWIVSIFRWT